MHGPTPLSEVRVITTCAPAPCKIACTRNATSNVYACSVYPPLVWVPAVSHARVPVPMKIGRLISDECDPLPPLCPASTTIVLPATAPSEPGPAGGGATVGGAVGGAVGAVVARVVVGAAVVGTVVAGATVVDVDVEVLVDVLTGGRVVRVAGDDE
jgi:hypothetical protein